MKHKFKALAIIILTLSIAFAYTQITVEKTIPEEVQISQILQFTININTKTIIVHLANGRQYTLNTSGFMDFWNNTMNQTQRNIVRGFITQCAALAADVDQGKISGEFRN